MIKRLFNSTSLKVNITANFLGNGGSAFLGMLFLPFYLSYVGAEGYGLIGIFSSLQSILFLLDAGLSYTLNKELASLSAQEGKEEEMNKLLKTFEILYWGLSLLVFMVALFLSPLIAKHWIQPGALPYNDIIKSFYLLSASLLFQFPSGLYTGGLLGLQRHFSLNITKLFFALSKGIGALLVLKYIDSSVVAFFAWNLVIVFFNAVAYRWILWAGMPKISQKVQFDFAHIKSKWRFAAGMTGISIAAILLTQSDKVILSKILTLKEFGYYSIATTLGLVIYQFIVPISQSYFPRLASLVAKNDLLILKKTYHQGCQLLSIVVLPVTFMLCFFSKEIISIWLKDKTVIDHTWLIVSIYSVGTAFNGLVHMPFMLSLSYGKPKIFFYANLFLLLFMIPGVFIGALYYGSAGGASCWAILNIIYVIVMPYLVHKQMLKEELKTWYWQDTVKPLLGALTIVLLARWLFSFENLSVFTRLFFFAIIGLTSLIAAIVTTRQRKLLIGRL